MREHLCLVVFMLVGCGGGAGSSAPSTPAGSGPAPAGDEASSSKGTPAAGEGADYVTPPFTAADLQAGLPAGTEIRYRLESAGAPTVIEHWVFTASDEKGCTIASRVLAEDGTLIKDEGEGTNTWAELETHAHFPAASTTRTDSSVDVPAGHFETWLFEVRPTESGAPLRRYHFARNLPGPPVWMEITKDGQLVTRMVLLSRTQPRATSSP